MKIFLKVSDDVAAHRVYNDKARHNQQKPTSLEEQKMLSIERNGSDRRRYKRMYGIDDFADPKNFDLLIDTTHEHDPEKNCQKILEYLLAKKLVSINALDK